MAPNMAVQVTMYLTEGDSWHHQPLHLEILRYLREENVAGAVVVSRVLPKLREMAAHRLIVRENVVIEQGSLD
jgi:PII-like signaling protein